jgi:predicted kinase
LAAVLAERKRGGFVRECHGDLHLGNMVLVDGRVRIFDAIEFNPELRWIDVMSEVAFLAMDLLQRGRGDLAFRFVNAYLERTGDYEGVRVLRYYLVYRALVRAKVAAIRAAQDETPGPQRSTLQSKCRHHLRVAHELAQGSQAALIINHGVSGSGKTHASQIILESIGAIRVRSDVERKRAYGLAASARTGAGIGEGLYAGDATSATYARLAALAQAIVEGGFPAVADATFLKREQRDRFRALAARLHAGFAIADFQAPEAVLRARVQQRERAAADASEAGLAVLEHQLRTAEPLAPAEQASVFVFDTSLMSEEEIRTQARRMLESLSPEPRAH